MRTQQQRAGDAAEDIVAQRLSAAGWDVLARQVRVGRDELDIVAVDPGPPRTTVVVEVRWRRDRAFGLPEESLDWAKRTRLRRACGQLLERGLGKGAPPIALPVRVDLIVVEPPARGREPRVRHYRHALGA
jgi:putative endonuclease